jgi:Tfp pilus assembly protein PilF
MKRFWAALVLLLLVPGSASAEFTAEQLLANAGVTMGPEYQDVTEAYARFEKQDLAASEAMLIAAKQKHPELAPGRVMLAQLLLSRNQLGLARRELEQQVVADPADPEAYLLFAELALQDQRVTDANLALEQARKLIDGAGANAARKAKLLSRVYAGLAAVNEARQNWPVAQTYLGEWLKLDPQNPAAHERLGRILFIAGKQESAYKEFEAAAKSPTNLVPALPEILMGQLYEHAGNHANATKWMTAAIRLSGDNLATQLAVARWALQTNQLTEAATHAQAALTLDEKSFEAMLLCGTVARLQNDLSGAEKYLAAASLQSPLSFEATNLLALTLCEEADQTKRQRALGLARTNVEKNPRNSEALATLGWVYERLGQHVESEQALSRAVAAGPLSTNGAFYIANMLERKGHREDAAKLLAKALESNQPYLYKDQAEKLAARLQLAARAAADQAAADAAKAATAKPDAAKPDNGNDLPATKTENK